MLSFLPGTTCPNLVALIISYCRSLFSTFFSNSRVKFVMRQANAVAHTLAREVTSLASPAVYFNISACIETLIINEML
jgi:putative flippase GtrA